jgi:hypothetical protein
MSPRLLACVLGWILAVVGLTFLVPACAKSDPKSLTDQGYAELGRSEWKSARDSFGEALKKLQPADELYVRAKLGEVEALVKLEPERARDEFLALGRSQPSRIEAKDYSLVAGKLAGERKYSVAVDVMDAGLKAHVEHPKMIAVKDSIVELSLKAADPEALQKLKSLGYL